MSTIGVIGAGAWGTALAVLAARRGDNVHMWTRNADFALAVEAARENSVYLPGIKLDPAIRVSADPAVLADTNIILMVTPTQHVRAVLSMLDSAIAPDAKVVICSKGIELSTGQFLSAVVADLLPGRTIAVLTGPSFADEVANDLPTAVTIACQDQAIGVELVASLGNRTFRPYLTDDVIGAQIGGAVKNILAIACGICAGRNFGDNARAALITRGLAEIGRLIVALGGRNETLMGLSGLGDVTLTCTSNRSRNYALGVALGQGNTLASLLEGRHTVAEGVASAGAVAAMAAAHGVDMPIVSAVDAVLHKKADLDETVRALLTRPFRAETERA